MTQKLCQTQQTREIPPPVVPSYLLAALCKKVSETLVIAQHKTATERKDLLPFLKQFRDDFIENDQAEEINLPTSNGTTINGLHFHGCQKNALIYLHGNGYFYETGLEKPLRWREGLKISIDGAFQYPHLVVCNPGGTGKSEGNTHPLTVARDLLAQFEYLVLEHSIDPNNIAIAGYSMGGFLGSFGAALIQQRFPEAEINFLSERSFHTIYSRADFLMYIPICLTRWDQNSIAALESLKGRVCIVYHKGDGVVPYADSTHQALAKTQKSRTYSYLELREEKMQESDSEAHNRAFSQEENQQVIAELKRMLKIPLTEEEEKLSLDTF